MRYEWHSFSMITDLAQSFSICPNNVEIWRQVFETDNYEVAMWVKDLALDNLMKVYSGPNIDIMYRSGH